METKMLRGEKKQRAPRLWSQKQNQLRKLRDREREQEQKELEGGGSSRVGLAFRGHPVRISREDLGGI